MSEKKIDNTFMRSLDQINNLEKVFREGGLLEKAAMDISKAILHGLKILERHYLMLMNSGRWTYWRSRI